MTRSGGMRFGFLLFAMVGGAAAQAQYLVGGQPKTYQPDSNAPAQTYQPYANSTAPIILPKPNSGAQTFQPYAPSGPSIVQRIETNPYVAGANNARQAVGSCGKTVRGGVAANVICPAMVVAPEVAVPACLATGGYAAYQARKCGTNLGELQQNVTDARSQYRYAPSPRR